MSRQLLCETCGAKHSGPLCQEDMDDGIKSRTVRLLAKRPDNLNIEIITDTSRQVIPVTELVCDFCNDEIKDGQPCVALTLYQGDEPEAWESEYGTLL